jgi:hypothetical protein
MILREGRNCEKNVNSVSTIAARQLLTTSDSQTIHIPETCLKPNMSMIHAQRCRSDAGFHGQGFGSPHSPCSDPFAALRLIL